MLLLQSHNADDIKFYHHPSHPKFDPDLAQYTFSQFLYACLGVFASTDDDI